MNEASVTCQDKSPLVELIAVSKYFDGGLVCGLADIDLKVYPGEAVSIVGPSGSGKSTLLNVIGTLDFPTAGELRLDGERVTRKSDLDSLRCNKLGFIFQLHNLIPSLTLLENVTLPLRGRKWSRKEKKARGEELLQRVGLAQRIHFLPTKVSGGERQRAAIARALVNDPDIILGDEPTGNLDSASGEAVMELMMDLLRDSSKTLIVVTHNPEIAKSTNRQIRIVDGKIDNSI